MFLRRLRKVEVDRNAFRSADDLAVDLAAECSSAGCHHCTLLIRAAGKLVVFGRPKDILSMHLEDLQDRCLEPLAKPLVEIDEPVTETRCQGSAHQALPRAHKANQVNAGHPYNGIT